MIQCCKLTNLCFDENNFVINLFIKDILKTDTRTGISELRSNKIIMILLAESRHEVNEWVGLIKKAGKEVRVDPHEIV